MADKSEQKTHSPAPSASQSEKTLPGAILQPPDLVEAIAEPLPSSSAGTPYLAPTIGFENPAAGNRIRAGGWPTIAGYEILGELGRGGMGVVYKARQVQLNRLVALKMILAGVHGSSVQLARFLAEAEAVAQLQHPNIVQIYEVGRHGDLPFFSRWNTSRGGSLDKQLKGTPLAPAEAARLVEPLARAMHAAHQHGIIHRDLKPGNILLQPTDRQTFSPKITDFGLAKRVEGGPELTESGAIMGTPSYMAPEQADGKSSAVGPATDVYALGAILYELVSGRPPFKGATPLDTVMQILSEEPAPPSRWNPKLPRDLETICLKCLQKEPHQRYVSALALAEDLARFQAGEPVLARPVSRVERGLKWVRRHPALATVYGMAFVIMILGVVGGGIASLWQQAEGARQEAAYARDQLQGALSKEQEA